MIKHVLSLVLVINIFYKIFSSGNQNSIFKGKVFDFGGWPINLQRADITIHPKAECETRFRSTKLGRYFELHDTFICAGGEGLFEISSNNNFIYSN